MIELNDLEVLEKTNDVNNILGKGSLSWTNEDGKRCLTWVRNNGNIISACLERHGGRTRISFDRIKAKNNKRNEVKSHVTISGVGAENYLT